MALRGIKVVEFVGLAPGPFCGAILADHGALVTRIDRNPDNLMDVLKAGKRTIALDLKKPEAVQLVRKLCKQSDVLIEPFRPGVMEKLGLGPSTLLSENPRLIYARLTGFGQYGKYHQRAGHDINYLGISGLLSLFGRKDAKPTPPVNFAADFAGGSLMCAFGIAAALFERNQSGKGQVVDCAMVEGAAYIGSWLTRSQQLFIWGRPRGENALDSGAHFYDTYGTKDGKFMTVGALEPQFYQELVEGLGVKITQFGDNDENRRILERVFKTKTQKEWCDVFDEKDACVFPVLEPKEAAQHPHNRDRNVFLEGTEEVVPQPAPKFDRTPAQSSVYAKEKSEIDQVLEILKEVGVGTEEAKRLQAEGAILLGIRSKL